MVNIYKARKRAGEKREKGLNAEKTQKLGQSAGGEA